MLHDHLSGKGLGPKTAGELSAPGSKAPEGEFKPEGSKEVIESAHDSIRKE